MEQIIEVLKKKKKTIMQSCPFLKFVKKNRTSKNFLMINLFIITWN